MELWMLLFVCLGAVVLVVGVLITVLYAFVWLIEFLQFRALKRRTRRYSKGEQ